MFDVIVFGSMLLYLGLAQCQGYPVVAAFGSSAFVHNRHSTLIQRKLTRRDTNNGNDSPILNPLHMITRSQRLSMSSDISRDESEKALSLPSEKDDDTPHTSTDSEGDNWMKGLLSDFSQFFKTGIETYKRPPPLQVEDTSVLFYDILLLLNLTLSISFWVVHRMSFEFIGSAISEGSLFCILWIIAGLFNGAFLNSAVDGHYGSMDDKGGPKAAGMLGLHTFISASNMRIVVALLVAVLEHRQVGELPGEQLIPLEIAFGLVLMSLWRALHSSFVPRM